jgi:hypothetical protein
MSELNRIKVVLVEQRKTGKWLAEQLGVSVPLQVVGVQMQLSLIFKL